MLPAISAFFPRWKTPPRDREVASGAPLFARDIVWLQMQPRPVVAAVLQFATLVPRAKIIDLVDSRLLTIPRFSESIADGAWPQWTPTDLNTAGHVQHFELPRDADLHGEIAQRLRGTLRMDRPPWEITLIDQPDQPTTMLVLAHHVMGDGTSFMKALLQCDDDPTRCEKAIAQAAAAPIRSRSLGWDKLCTYTWREFKAISNLFIRPVDTRPCALKSSLPVRDIALRGPLSWPLPQVKSAGKKLGDSATGIPGTVNDVLLAAVAGGLRRYVEGRGDCPQELRVHCLQPIQIGALPAAQFGNTVSIGISALPVQQPELTARFRELQTTMRALKTSVMPWLFSYGAMLLAYLPGWATRSVYKYVTERSSVFVSNVPGPSQPVSLMNYEVKKLWWFGPPFHNIALQFPAHSYAGFFNIGLAADTQVITDVDALQQAVSDEMSALLGKLADSASAAHEATPRLS